MSAFAYGRITSRRTSIAPAALLAADHASGQDENKLIAALAGLVPVEIIAAHALVLAATTTTDKAGTTTITSSGPLQASLLVLVAAAVVVFLLGRGLADWKGVDFVRLAIPPTAFLVWTALIGTSALTPWLGSFDHAAVTVVAVGVGVILVAVSARVTTPKAT